MNEIELLDVYRRYCRLLESELERMRLVQKKSGLNDSNRTEEPSTEINVLSKDTNEISDQQELSEKKSRRLRVLSAQSVDGKRIRTLREAKGLSQDVLGKKIGVHMSSISKWELGRQQPTERRLQEIAEVLEVNTTDLMKSA